VTDSLFDLYYGNGRVPLSWLVKWSTGGTDPVRAAWKKSREHIFMLSVLTPIDQDLMGRIVLAFHRGARESTANIMNIFHDYPNVLKDAESAYWQIIDYHDPTQQTNRQLVRALLKTVRTHEIPTIKDFLAKTARTQRAL
jgi:hypothetical protein